METCFYKSILTFRPLYGKKFWPHRATSTTNQNVAYRAFCLVDDFVNIDDIHLKLSKKLNYKMYFGSNYKPKMIHFYASRYTDTINKM